MEKILNWSIAQQSGDKEAIERIGQPDPELLAQLFGHGPDEPTLMKQAISVVTNPEATLENKEIAFDNFEMLIENMDNANNIENLKLWPSVIDQLSPQNDNSLRVYAASIIGIAVQNNPKSQEDFLKHCPRGLEQLISIARPSSQQNQSAELVHKSLFAIASFIRNFEPGYQQFSELDGWSVVAENLSATATIDHKTKLRVLSMVSAILSTGLENDEAKDDKVRRIGEINLVHHLVSTFNNTTDPHIGCIDKALNIISQLASHKHKFTNDEVAELAKGLENIDSIRDQISEDDFNFAKQVVN